MKGLKTMNGYKHEFKQEEFVDIYKCDSSPVYSWIWNSEITKEVIQE